MLRFRNQREEQLHHLLHQKLLVEGYLQRKQLRNREFEYPFLHTQCLIILRLRHYNRTGGKRQEFRRCRLTRPAPVSEEVYTNVLPCV